MMVTVFIKLACMKAPSYPLSTMMIMVVAEEVEVVVVEVASQISISAGREVEARTITMAT